MIYLEGFCTVIFLTLIFKFLIVSKKYFKGWQKIVMGGALTYLVFFELNGLGKAPGLFGDEAFNFYNSWSLAHFGVDSNLLHNPVYSVSAGGQSILYEWLAVPFMKTFGMNLVAYRFPMAFLTILSVLFLIFALYKNKVTPKIILGVSVSLSTAEWLLMYGHWAMDCNIVVPMFIFAVGFIILSFTQKKIYGYVGIVLIDLMAYCYVGAWISLPFIFIGTICFLYNLEKFNKKDIYRLIFISAVLLFPIFCYVLVQFIGVKPFKFLWFTVASLPQTRAANSMISFSGNIINNVISNLASGLGQLITGNDSWLQTSIPGYAVIYFLMFLLMIYGVVCVVKEKKNVVTKFLIILSFSLIPLILFVQANFTHWAVVLFIAYLWAGIGLGKLFELAGKRIVKVVILLTIFIVSVDFTHYYFKDYTNTEVTANQIPSYVIDFNNSKKFVSELDNLHVKTYYGFPFYNSDRPSNNIEFLECIKRPNPHKISRLEEKYQPSIPTQITSGSAAYIIPEDQVDNYNYLESLPSKILRVNGQNYVVFYKGN